MKRYDDGGLCKEDRFSRLDEAFTECEVEIVGDEGRCLGAGEC